MSEDPFMFPLHPAARDFLGRRSALGASPIYQMQIPAARTLLEQAQQSCPVENKPAALEDRELPTEAGPVPIRIVRPLDVAGSLPVVIYLHGGGWALGGENTHDHLVRELACGAQVAVVFVDYTLSPEARYPVAIEQAFAVARWMAAHGLSIGLDGSRMAVAGDGAGGNLAAALTILAKQRGGLKLLCQVLFYPVTDADFDTRSYHDFAEGFLLAREAMKWFWDLYAPDAGVRSEPLASPLRAPSDLLKDLPPALVVTAECDVLRDEGEAYAHRLIEAGVSVRAVRHLGIIHDFVMLHALAATPAAREAIGQAVGLLRETLYGGPN